MIHRQHPNEYLACLYLGLADARRDQLDRCMEVWKKFVDRDHIGVMREIGVQRALFETGEPLTGADVAQAVETALAQG